MSGSRSHSEKSKSSQNRPISVVIFWSSIPCVFCLYMDIHCTLLKVVNYYDLSVPSMSVKGFQNKTLFFVEVKGRMV